MRECWRPPWTARQHARTAMPPVASSRSARRRAAVAGRPWHLKASRDCATGPARVRRHSRAGRSARARASAKRGSRALLLRLVVPQPHRWACRSCPAAPSATSPVVASVPASSAEPLPAAPLPSSPGPSLSTPSLAAVASPAPRPLPQTDAQLKASTLAAAAHATQARWTGAPAEKAGPAARQASCLWPAFDTPPCTSKPERPQQRLGTPLTSRNTIPGVLDARVLRLSRVSCV